MSNNKYILELKEIDKQFPGVHALDHVSFNVTAGSVHGIIGENGAGKSTLMKILIGIQPPTSGTVIFNGEEVHFKTPAEALNRGIAMVHQELMPIRELTVAQSIFIGKEPIGPLGHIDDRKMVEETQKLFDRLKITINPRVKIGSLSTANIQMVEIAKAISYDAKLIIMDEPSSSLTENEVEKMFDMMNMLKAQGVTILYISHKMNEITKITDELTVMRDGHYICSMVTAEHTLDEMISAMVGRDIANMFPKLEAEIGAPLMEVKGLTRKGVFKDISFTLHKGEILGFAGLVGAGRSEVMRAIFGLDPLDAGEVFIDGKKVDIKTPSDAIAQGMILLTEERKKDGLFLVHSVSDNMTIANIDAYKAGPSLNKKKMRDDVAEQIDLLSIKTPSQTQIINNLSGGNQQKVLLSKWLLTNPRILIVDEPTRGIDVGAKAEIHLLLSKLAQQGCGIIMISSELPEVLGMSDRIVVMHEGDKTGEVLRAEANEENVMHLAFGFPNQG